MKLQEQINRIQTMMGLKEETDLATRRRFVQVKRALEGVLRSSYPCDYDNFKLYFLGMIVELNQYYRFIHQGSDMDSVEPETIVRKYLKNLVKEYYLENTKDC